MKSRPTLLKTLALLLIALASGAVWTAKALRDAEARAFSGLEHTAEGLKRYQTWADDRSTSANRFARLWTALTPLEQHWEEVEAERVELETEAAIAAADGPALRTYLVLHPDGRQAPAARAAFETLYRAAAQKYAAGAAGAAPEAIKAMRALFLLCADRLHAGNAPPAVGVEVPPLEDAAAIGEKDAGSTFSAQNTWERTKDIEHELERSSDAVFPALLRFYQSERRLEPPRLRIKSTLRATGEKFVVNRNGSRYGTYPRFELRFDVTLEVSATEIYAFTIRANPEPEHGEKQRDRDMGRAGQMAGFYEAMAHSAYWLLVPKILAELRF